MHLGFYGSCRVYSHLASGLFSVVFLDRVNDGNICSPIFSPFAGMLGLEVTGDFFNFFVFLEIASVASFGLIAFGAIDPKR